MRISDYPNNILGTKASISPFRSRGNARRGRPRLAEYILACVPLIANNTRPAAVLTGDAFGGLYDLPEKLCQINTLRGEGVRDGPGWDARKAFKI